MIGVAFALPGTFVDNDRVERAAFERAFRTLVQTRGWAFDEELLLRALHSTDRRFTERGSIATAFSAALEPSRTGELDNLALEALFRAAGAQSVADSFVPFADVAPTLNELAAMNVPRAALSSGWSGIEQCKAQAVGFDGPLVLTEDLGIPASSSQAFAAIAKILMLPANRIWYVGTDPQSDMLPARAAGLKTIWVNRTGAPFPADRDVPDITIDSFGALLGAISEPYTRGLLAMRHLLRTAME